MAGSANKSISNLKSRMLSGADHDINIEEYRREFSYLKLPPAANLSIEQDKDRYIFVYFLRKIMIMACAVFLTSVTVCLLAVNLPDSSISKAYAFSWNLRNIWPWDDSLQWQLNSSGLMKDPDQERFVIACSFASFIWIIWISIAAYYGAMKSRWYSKSLNGFLCLFATTSMISWLCAAYGLFDKPSVAPSVYDNIVVLVSKMMILISIAYFSIGIFLFSLLAKAKQLIVGRQNG